MKDHIGVVSESSLIHSVEMNAANVHDLTPACDRWQQALVGQQLHFGVLIGCYKGASWAAQSTWVAGHSCSCAAISC